MSSYSYDDGEEMLQSFQHYASQCAAFAGSGSRLSTSSLSSTSNAGLAGESSTAADQLSSVVAAGRLLYDWLHRWDGLAWMQSLLRAKPEALAKPLQQLVHWLAHRSDSGAETVDFRTYLAILEAVTCLEWQEKDLEWLADDLYVVVTAVLHRSEHDLPDEVVFHCLVVLGILNLDCAFSPRDKGNRVWLVEYLVRYLRIAVTSDRSEVDIEPLFHGLRGLIGLVIHAPTSDQIVRTHAIDLWEVAVLNLRATAVVGSMDLDGSANDMGATDAARSNGSVQQKALGDLHEMCGELLQVLSANEEARRSVVRASITRPFESIFGGLLGDRSKSMIQGALNQMVNMPMTSAASTPSSQPAPKAGTPQRRESFRESASVDESRDVVASLRLENAELRQQLLGVLDDLAPVLHPQTSVADRLEQTREDLLTRRPVRNYSPSDRRQKPLEHSGHNDRQPQSQPQSSSAAVSPQALLASLRESASAITARHREREAAWTQQRSELTADLHSSNGERDRIRALLHRQDEEFKADRVRRMALQQRHEDDRKLARSELRSRLISEAANAPVSSLSPSQSPSTKADQSRQMSMDTGSLRSMLEGALRIT